MLMLVKATWLIWWPWNYSGVCDHGPLPYSREWPCGYCRKQKHYGIIQHIWQGASLRTFSDVDPPIVGSGGNRPIKQLDG